jgi:hypothetical protein
MEKYNHKFTLLDQAIHDAENITEESLQVNWDENAPVTQAVENHEKKRAFTLQSGKE